MKHEHKPQTELARTDRQPGVGRSGQSPEQGPVSAVLPLPLPGAGTDPLGGTSATSTLTAELGRRRGGGAPLPVGLATDLGRPLGAELSAVRVHTDARADGLARSLQAEAFTHGPDVFFSAGAYAPTTPRGQDLLAHELAHVVQSASGSPTRPAGTLVGRADDAAERHADEAATAAVAALRQTPAAGSSDPVPGSARVSAAAAVDGTVRRRLSVKELREQHERVIREEQAAARERRPIARQPAARGSGAAGAVPAPSQSAPPVVGAGSAVAQPQADRPATSATSEEQPQDARGTGLAPHAAPVASQYSTAPGGGSPYSRETDDGRLDHDDDSESSSDDEDYDSDDEEYDEEPEAAGPVTEARERRGSHRAWSLTQIGKQYVAEEGRTSDEASAAIELARRAVKDLYGALHADLHDLPAHIAALRLYTWIRPARSSTTCETASASSTSAGTGAPRLAP